MKSIIPLFLLALLSACAGPNPLTDIPSQTGDLSGFFSGLFHGAVLGFSLISSLFSHNISIYDVHNTGGWYDFGFVLGATAFGISSFKMIVATFITIIAIISSPRH